MRLNGWHRLGIVLSVAWILGSVMYGYFDRKSQAETVAIELLEGCTKDNWTLAPNERRDCMELYDRAYRNNVAIDDWPDYLLTNFGTVIGGWIAAYVLLWSGRWVRSGFKQS